MKAVANSPGSVSRVSVWLTRRATSLTGFGVGGVGPEQRTHGRHEQRRGHALADHVADDDAEPAVEVDQVVEIAAQFERAVVTRTHIEALETRCFGGEHAALHIGGETHVSAHLAVATALRFESSGCNGCGDLFSHGSREHLLALAEGDRAPREQAHHAVDLVLEDQADAEHALQALGGRRFAQRAVVVLAELRHDDDAPAEGLMVRGRAGCRAR